MKRPVFWLFVLALSCAGLGPLPTPCAPNEQGPVTPEGGHAGAARYAEASGTGNKGAGVAGKGRVFSLKPLFLYSPESGPAAGATLELGFPSSGPGGRTDLYQFRSTFLYSSNEQALAELNTNLPLGHDGMRLLADLGYRKYPYEFYGVGNDTLEEQEEEVLDTTLYGSFTLRQALAPRLSAGLGWRVAQHDVTFDEPGSLSEESLVGGEGGVVSGIGCTLTRDARDAPMYPRRGTYVHALAYIHAGPLGSDFDFTRYVVDSRAYLPLFRSHVLAFQLYGAFSGGEPPFFELPALGGSSRMRGYYEGRYRDRQYVTLQGEYRLPLVWRLGAAGFAGAGDVAETMGDFELDDLKYSYGAGLRFYLDGKRRAALRLDFAFGSDSSGADTSGVYLVLFEAF